MFLCNSVERTAVKTVRILRHDLLLNFSEDSLFDGTDRTHFPVHVELPYPIHKPFKTADADAVTQLLKEKSEYVSTLTNKRKFYKGNQKAIIKKEIGKSNYVYLPRHLLEFYKDKDPDVYFDCEYNFYYTGGVLEHLQISGGDYLIRPDAENNLCLNDLRKPDFIAKFPSNCETPIFSINSVKYGKNHLLVLREKHHVSINKMKKIKTINKIWANKYHVPVVDAKLSPKKHEHLGVVLSNLELSVTDITTDEILFSFKNVNNRRADNFQQFQFLNENLIVLLDRFVLKIIDYQTKAVVNVFDPKVIDCNSLCNFRIMGNDILLSTRHYLMKTDLRNFEKLSYFSHSHNTPPCYMDFATKGDDTFLCLASQSQDSKTLFTGHSIYSLPYKVPDIQDTLKECRLHKPSLVLINSLDERLNFATAGLKVLNLDNEIFIYTTNYLGDIFRQKIFEDQSERTLAEPVETLFKWINDLEKPNPVLHVTSIKEMSDARFSLNSAPIERNLDRYNVESKADDFLKKFGPRYYRKNVAGNLAKDFLAVWNDDDDEDEDSEEIPEVPSHDKVNDWIKGHDFSDEKDNFEFVNC